MSVFNDDEYALLQHISKTNEVPEDQQEIADRLEFMGFIRQGFDTQQGRFTVTASLTFVGKDFFAVDRRYRWSPWRQFLYKWFSPLFAA
ncbi:MAG: hypothetical protein KBC48_03160 [Candidatus Pacebacteria bacterium]|nr:hypothetical protein [Candidatus Paceibacterota bacterium]